MTDQKQDPKPLTIEQVKKMSTDEINADWDAVQEALQANRHEPEEDA